MSAKTKTFETPKPVGLRGWVTERVFEPRLLSRLQRQTHPNLLRAAVEPVETGRAEAGLKLLGGIYAFAHAEERALPNAIWRRPPPSLPWAEALHSFRWLQDLDAVGDSRAQVLASQLTMSWIKAHEDYTMLPWRPDLAACRLWFWLRFAPLIAPGESGGDDERKLLKAMSVHADWVDAHAPAVPNGLPRLTCGAVLTLASAMIEGRETQTAQAVERLTAAIDEAILSDGGAQSRSPTDTLEIFALLLELQAHLELLECSVPRVLPDSLARVARAVRFLRLPSGRAPVFHGGWEMSDGRMDTLLTHSRAPAEILGILPESGYLKMTGGRVAVVMDVGRAPTGPAADSGHASPLAFEFESGRRRIVVNCGSGDSLGNEWERVCRVSAAHSTVVVEDRSAAKAQNTTGGRTQFVGPQSIEHDRKEETNGVWMLGAHDGYAASLGITLTRRLFLAADGGDFRGEDTFEVEDVGERAFRRRLGQLAGSEQVHGIPFAVRFHLHPDVSPELVADSDAVTLRLPHGEIWVMRQSGGRLSLEPSVYLGEGRGPRETRQVVISGGIPEKDVKLRWAFRRVGDISKLPADPGALLQHDESEAVGFDELSEPPFGI
ncbi:MAG: heparinase II/III family protein [Pseudomonadota bacterium]